MKFRVKRYSIYVALAAVASAQSKSFVESSDAELVRALPELSQVRFARAPDFPDDLRTPARDSLERLPARFAGASTAAAVHEMRLDRATMLWTSSVRTDGSMEALRLLLPSVGAESRFRYIGTASLGGKNVFVAAFAGTAGAQGIVWIDAASKAIVRLLLQRPETRADITFAGLLPARATVDTHDAAGELHTVYRFPNSPELRTEDAIEMLVRGAELARTKPAEALKVLSEAFRLSQDRPEIRYLITYQRALAFEAIGDLADAEADLREAVSRMPDCAPAHNYLGIILFRLGKKEAAADEFRAATRLAPADPNAHSNLGDALAKSAEVEPTIHVDVRQVLVPVVVTDRQGHHVTGLTERDFKVLEDGVEQKITAFNVEHSALPQTGTQAAVVTPSRSPAATLESPARRTYLICIDTLHASFNNFETAREALVKLFQHERSEDSQYVVIALGASAQVVLNVTRDPNSVQTALKSKNFQKIFLDGQQGGLKQELESYRRDLNETRQACDLFGKTGEMPFQIKCEAGKTRAPQRARLISDLDRTLTIGFLRQFRFLVAQLARAGDRRTIVLLSDGFQIVPGREAYDLLNAYFPEMTGHSLPATERMQDEFEPILQLAAKSNITIDTIDTRGLYGSSTFDASSQGATVTVAASVDRTDRNVAAANGNTLAEIAAATGGTAFHDNNNLLGGLERAFADGRDYYTIAYISGNANQDGKFRAISVQVPNRDLVINAKRGYWSDRGAQ